MNVPESFTPRVASIGISLTVVLGCLITAFFNFEYFPFSNYPMYSKVFTPEVYCAHNVYGQTVHEEKMEKISLVGLVSPGHTSIINELLERHWWRSRKRAEFILYGLLDIYEYRRRKYFQNVPELKEMSFVKSCWKWATFLEFALVKGQLKKSFPPPYKEEVLLRVSH